LKFFVAFEIECVIATGCLDFRFGVYFRSMNTLTEAPIATVLTRTVVVLVSALSLVACSALPSNVVTEKPTAVNFDGLADVRSRSLDVAQERPGTNFARYSGLLLSPPELAFKTPDRSKKEFALTEDQQSRFRDIVAGAFESEFSKMQMMPLVKERGADVLELSVRVQDIVANVSPTSLSPVGRGAAFLEASGAATLVIELSDSMSKEILARGIDTSAVDGVAMRQGDEMVTRWQGVEKLSERWASIGRAGVSSLISSGN
jgi:hypothetical protein